MGWAQSEFPFFEQAAFDFYQSEILKLYPSEKKVTVYRYYMDFQDSNMYFSEGECLKNPVFKKDVSKLDRKKYGQDDIESSKFELDPSNINKKQFRIRRNNGGRFPKLYLSYPRVAENNRFFINVYELTEMQGNIYHLELDINGKVIDWCKSEYVTMIIH